MVGYIKITIKNLENSADYFAKMKEEFAQRDDLKELVPEIEKRITALEKAKKRKK